jgi:hypothetical protein
LYLTLIYPEKTLPPMPEIKNRFLGENRADRQAGIVKIEPGAGSYYF